MICIIALCVEADAHIRYSGENSGCRTSITGDLGAPIFHKLPNGSLKVENGERYDGDEWNSPYPRSNPDSTLYPGDIKSFEFTITHRGQACMQKEFFVNTHGAIEMMESYLYPNKDNDKSIDLPYHKPSKSVRSTYQLYDLEKQREILCGNNPECKWNSGTIQDNYMVFTKTENPYKSYKSVTTKFIGNIQADLFETNNCHGYMKRSHLDGYIKSYGDQYGYGGADGYKWGKKTVPYDDHITWSGGKDFERLKLGGVNEVLNPMRDDGPPILLSAEIRLHPEDLVGDDKKSFPDRMKPSEIVMTFSKPMTTKDSNDNLRMFGKPVNVTSISTKYSSQVVILGIIASEPSINSKDKHPTIYNFNPQSWINEEIDFGEYKDRKNGQGQIPIFENNCGYIYLEHEVGTRHSAPPHDKDKPTPSPNYSSWVVQLLPQTRAPTADIIFTEHIIKDPYGYNAANPDMTNYVWDPIAISHDVDFVHDGARAGGIHFEYLRGMSADFEILLENRNTKYPIKYVQPLPEAYPDETERQEGMIRGGSKGYVQLFPSIKPLVEEAGYECVERRCHTPLEIKHEEKRDVRGYDGDSDRFYTPDEPPGDPLKAYGIGFLPYMISTENGGGMYAYVAPTKSEIGDHNITYLVNIYNTIYNQTTAQWEKHLMNRHLGYEMQRVVTYEPLFKHYEYPVLKDANRYAYDDRQGIMVWYGGSFGDGEPDNFSLNPDRRSRINAFYQDTIIFSENEHSFELEPGTVMEFNPPIHTRDHLVFAPITPDGFGHIDHINAAIVNGTVISGTLKDIDGTPHNLDSEGNLVAEPLHSTWEPLDGQQTTRVTIRPDNTDSFVRFGEVKEIISGDMMHVGHFIVKLTLIDVSSEEEAKAFLTSICPVGSEAFYDADAITSQDHTIMAKVWCNDFATTVNEKMVKSGFADITSSLCSSSKFQDELWARDCRPASISLDGWGHAMFEHAGHGIIRLHQEISDYVLSEDAWNAKYNNATTTNEMISERWAGHHAFRNWDYTYQYPHAAKAQEFNVTSILNGTIPSHKVITVSVEPVEITHDSDTIPHVPQDGDVVISLDEYMFAKTKYDVTNQYNEILGELFAIGVKSEMPSMTNMASGENGELSMWINKTAVTFSCELSTDPRPCKDDVEGAIYLDDDVELPDIEGFDPETGIIGMSVYHALQNPLYVTATITTGNHLPAEPFPVSSTGIFGVVYVDSNDNDILDAGESGVPYMEVIAVNFEDSTDISRITTNADGFYYFDGIVGGYLIQVEDTPAHEYVIIPENDILSQNLGLPQIVDGVE